MRSPLLLLPLLLACPKPPDTGAPTETGLPVVDGDGDGWSASEDCDDGDSQVNPGATEICDGRDNDCDGSTDDGVLTRYYADLDGDFHGDPSVSSWACSAPDHTSLVGDDCDDTEASVWPGAPEICDGLNNDCDGATDEGLVSTWWTDNDGDGWGDASTALTSCAPPSDAVDNPDDCDDARADVGPGAPEACDGVDNDCDGEADEYLGDTWYADSDGDGHGDPTRSLLSCDPGAGWVTSNGDCDDTDSAIHPAAVEVCDGADNDCDGESDEPDATDATVFYRDADGDGWGASTTVRACRAPSGYADRAGDCDDANSLSSPDAEELCDGVDNDCDGTEDEPSAVDAPTWYLDVDGDGYGGLSSTRACAAPEGWVSSDNDCDDSATGTHPGAMELCDGIDTDCDGTLDESHAVDAPTWYEDKDDDGHGGDLSTASCACPSGHVAGSGDCDDADPGISPGAPETCDGEDDDCDGEVDEDDALDAPTWYRDADGDGWGVSTTTRVQCDEPEGASALDGDCDDGVADISPSAIERCDGVDNDCDGDVDEPSATDTLSWYQDGDGDGHGSSVVRAMACEAPDGFVAGASDGVAFDCDDTSALIHPGAPEHCDDVDEDCDGTEDETPVDGTPFYEDSDADGFGDPDSRVSVCHLPTGYSLDATDCEPEEGTAFPGSEAWETPHDGVDQDCDGYDGCTDLNCDGYADIVIPNYYNGTTYSVTAPVYYGGASGWTLGLSASVKGLRAQIIQDLDGDGFQDVVFANHWDGSKYALDSLVYWGSATGLSTSRTTALPTVSPLAVDAQDLDNDGWPDLVFPGYYTGTSWSSEARIFWGSSAGYAPTDLTLLPTQGSHSMVVEDLDDDGWTDLVFPGFYSGTSYSATAYIYWGGEGGFSTDRRTSVASLGTVYAFARDLDLDGWDDLVLVNWYSGTSYSTNSYVYWGSESGFWSTSCTYLPTVGAYTATTGDFNGDDWPDLAFPSHVTTCSSTACTYGTVATLYWGSATGYASTRSTTVPAQATMHLGAADLNHDGFDDLVVPNYNTGTTHASTSWIYWGSATGVSTASRSDLATTGALRVRITDLDNDGWEDLMFSSHYYGGYSTSSWVFLNKSGTFSSTYRYALASLGPYVEMDAAVP